MNLTQENLLPRTEIRQQATRKSSGPRLLLLVLALTLITGALFFAGWTRHRRLEDAVTSAANLQRDSLPVVNVAKVRRAPANSELLIPGSMTALTEASIYARAAGYIKKRYADIGDHVKEGQLLAEIDSPDLDQQVAQARATLAGVESQAVQARAQLENQQASLSLARVTWDRYRTLQARGAIARQDADQQETNFHTAEASVRAAQANINAFDESVRASKANLERLIAMQDYEKVRAPFTGVITARSFDTGALVSATGASQGAANPNAGVTAGELFKIAQANVLRIMLNVSQQNAPTIKVGQPADVFVREFPNRTFPGRVSRTANTLEVTSRTLLTEVQVPNPQMILIPGMYATVQLTRTSAAPPLLVPGDSIVTTNQGMQVAMLVEIKPGEREKHPATAREIHFVNVQTGRDYGQEVEITSGLQGWEYVVINPGDVVEEGAVVRPVTSAPKPLSPVQRAEPGKGVPGAPGK